MSIYQSAVKKPITTALIYVAIAIFGIFSIAQIPIDLLPDIETNSIMVMTTYEGASASDIENNVTKPLENTLNSVIGRYYTVQFVYNLRHFGKRGSKDIRDYDGMGGRPAGGHGRPPMGPPPGGRGPRF